jgi:hypothetical protein
VDHKVDVVAETLKVEITAEVAGSVDDRNRYRFQSRLTLFL